MGYDFVFNIKKKKRKKTNKSDIEAEFQEVYETFDELWSMSGFVKILISLSISLILIYPLIELIDSVSFLIYTTFLGTPTWTYTFQDFILLIITILISIGMLYSTFKIARWHYKRKGVKVD